MPSRVYPRAPAPPGTVVRDGKDGLQLIQSGGSRWTDEAEAVFRLFSTLAPRLRNLSRHGSQSRDVSRARPLAASLAGLRALFTLRDDCSSIAALRSGVQAY